jgi:hypothetical protein
MASRAPCKGGKHAYDAGQSINETSALVFVLIWNPYRKRKMVEYLAIPLETFFDTPFVEM